MDATGGFVGSDAHPFKEAVRLVELFENVARDALAVVGFDARVAVEFFALSAFHSIASRLVTGIFASFAQVFCELRCRVWASTPTIGSPGIGEQQGEK